ncbi:MULTISPECIES: hypothetical protein [unclassified Pseudonocardia]|jgi:hypothetical protein|uniref:hypothetical protein n=1 Tax=unclassified Pseudonocardia TaxID=2619320 RepID=UPI002604532B|nr:hypothetical protein [Pseudonocardia sp.]MCU1625298.1 hypothetical protein [Pseudonocardia sp.]MDT7698503.1 hypothetical protein [Pseudonocardiales bacterium]
MSVTNLIIIAGVLGLFSLATTVGLAESRAQSQAWQRIAEERRELHEWEGSLIRAAERRGCGTCELLAEYLRRRDEDRRRE